MFNIHFVNFSWPFVDRNFVRLMFYGEFGRYLAGDFKVYRIFNQNIMDICFFNIV